MSKQVTADTLLTSSDKAVTMVRPLVRELTKSIDEQVVAASANGRDYIEVDLPTVFNIQRLPRADVQIILYSELIKIYQDDPPVGRGFTVTFTPGVRPRMQLRWRHGLTDAERNVRKKIIDACAQAGVSPNTHTGATMGNGTIANPRGYNTTDRW